MLVKIADFFELELRCGWLGFALFLKVGKRAWWIERGA